MKFVLAILIFATLSGCATKRVMKDCEKVNEGPYYFCSEQFKVWR